MSDIKSVAGMKILVTGAAMGMGKLYATLAVQEGASDVVLWDINAPVLTDTVEELRALAGEGTTIHSYLVDVADRDAIMGAADAVLSEVGSPHVLINNAGIVRGNHYFWETDPVKDAELTMAINALAPMYITRAFLPTMIESDQECRVVTMASAAGLTTNPRMAAYCASKWAAVGFSDSVRLELEQAGHHHVKVTTVCPYYIKTGMFEGAKAGLLLPLLEPEDVVDEVWKAMRKGHAMVVLPKTVGRVFGVHKTMEDFTGRPTT